MRNTSPKDVVFKVKTNAPKRYVVTPNEDVIKAREMRIIKISTVAGVDSSGESRDRIALLSAVASDEMPPSLSQFVRFESTPFFMLSISMFSGSWWTKLGFRKSSSHVPSLVKTRFVLNSF